MKAATLRPTPCRSGKQRCSTNFTAITPGGSFTTLDLLSFTLTLQERYCFSTPLRLCHLLSTLTCSLVCSSRRYYLPVPRLSLSYTDANLYPFHCNFLL